jgi:hypothetical protein
MHSEVWQWACGRPGCTNADPVGSIVFDEFPWYNDGGPHTWPVAPYITTTGEIERCFRVVYLREDGPSVPPYIHECESVEFTITENSSKGCAVRPTNLNVIGGP